MNRSPHNTPSRSNLPFSLTSPVSSKDVRNSFLASLRRGNTLRPSISDKLMSKILYFELADEFARCTLRTGMLC